jgi:hypothetical protein
MLKRMAIGAVVGLATWFGSALAAEAQQITPTGPMSITAGTNSWTYTATIYLPTPMNFKVNTNIYKNGVLQTMFTQSVPNPGTNTYNFSQPCTVTFNVAAGDVVTFKAQLLWNRTTTNAADWNVTVTGTRPSSKTVQRTSLLALQSVDRDRRRE